MDTVTGTEGMRWKEDGRGRGDVLDERCSRGRGRERLRVVGG